MAAALLLASCGNKVNTDQLAFRTYGINCMNEGRYEEAVQAFQGALDCANGNITDVEIDICLYKAKALFFAGRNEDALEVYNAILDYDNDIPVAYYQRGCLFLVTGNHDWAI